MSSILEVAKAANVSPSTVSLVANGHPRVAAETRRRVEQAIKRMGYRPRSARKKRRHIGVLYARGMVIHHELVDYCRHWIEGIRESFGEKGADVSVNAGLKHADEDLMFARRLEKNDFDGVILMGVHRIDGYLSRTLQSGIPLVVMNQLPENTEFSSVCSDAWTASRIAIKHLMDLGHRRIAPIFARRTYGVAARLRESLDGIQEPELDLVRLPGGTPLRFEEPETFKPLAEQLIASGATACFTGDPIALRLADTLEQMGVKVPDDLSIVGWDDLGFTTASGLKLTSIGYDKYTMGLLAGQILQNLLAMNRSLANLNANVPVELVVGQTTAPAPAQAAQVQA